ncbi:MAG TPA: putative Ig domain-containing protein, partial [Rhodopila sp.]
APLNTQATAYSIATDTLPLMIDNVNNAPDAQGSVTLPPVSVSEQHPPGETVSQLFSSGFSDPLDNQYISSANPFGSISNSFAGIAITGNAASHSQGVWEYSLDGGATWTAIPTDVSRANAVILPGNAKLAFQPNGSYSGNPGELSVTLIDSSATPVAPGLTGAQLAAEGSAGIPLTAVSGIDIPTVGGSSAFSATTMTLGTLINPLPPIQPSTPVEAVGPLTSSFPDDLQQEPTDLGFWTTDDYLSRPLIPDLSIVGSVANRFIIVEQHAIIAVPPDIFQDTLPQPQLTYEAKLPDGTSLPSWITFNPNDLTFSGTPPEGAYGRLEILITARDIAGNSADATFNILIGREQQDLAGLLKPGHHRPLFLPPHVSNLAKGLRRATADMLRAEQKLAEQQLRHAVAGHAADRVSAQAALLADLPAPMVHTGGLSSALHDAGPMSALKRARALLDTLNDMDRHRPAA